MIAGPVLGIFFRALDVEAGEADQLGPRREPQQVRRLEPRDLGDAGGHVELHDGPAPHRGEQLQPRVGVDGDGVADGGEQRGVVDRVGVRVAVGELDAVFGRPCFDGVELAA